MQLDEPRQLNLYVFSFVSLFYVFLKIFYNSKLTLLRTNSTKRWYELIFCLPKGVLSCYKNINWFTVYSACHLL